MGCAKPAVPAVLDVSGVWVGEIVTEYATMPLRLDLEQTGQTLTGTATSETVMLDTLTGKVDAKQVNFSFFYNAGSIGSVDEVIARYAFTGTVTGDTLAGDVTFSANGFGPPLPGTFKFQKQP